ncbi:MAG: uracil DNA glycosylase [Trizodia sp. TS-e1964]|nr:MAG: uracil DNA glycosylase [Trizodia sp. TS-e1964]
MSLKRKATEAALADSKKPKTNASITSFFAGPKPSALPVSKFNKAKWVDSLTSEQRDLLKLEIDTLHESWLAHLKEDVVSKDFLDLKRFLKKELESGVKVFPPMEDVYSWSRHTPLPSVKAVIIGQDPYHNHNQAHGMCFSVRPPTRAPPSLVNIYKALKIDYPSFKPPPNNGGLLTPWSDRGVLLINTCLTVRAHAAKSHEKKGWEKFTSRVIDIVCKTRTAGVVFLSWGSPAAHVVARVDRKRHCVLQSVHPSPLSASRGFFECGHFKKANQWLKERYGEGSEIDWNLDPSSAEATSTVDSTSTMTKIASPTKDHIEFATTNVDIIDTLDQDGEDALPDAEAEAAQTQSEPEPLTTKVLPPEVSDVSAEQLQELADSDNDF